MSGVTPFADVNPSAPVTDILIVSPAPCEPPPPHSPTLSPQRHPSQMTQPPRSRSPTKRRSSVTAPVVATGEPRPSTSRGLKQTSPHTSGEWFEKSITLHI